MRCKGWRGGDTNCSPSRPPSRPFPNLSAVTFQDGANGYGQPSKRRKSSPLPQGASAVSSAASPTACLVCTFLNAAGMKKCEMCGSTLQPEFADIASSAAAAGLAQPKQKPAARKQKQKQPARKRKTSATGSGKKDVASFFGLGPPHSSAPEADDGAGAAVTVSVSPPGWPKAVGELVALGYATRSGSNASLIRPGDQVTVQRVRQVKVDGGGGGGGQRWGAKQKEDTIVRFAVRGTDVGRLPKDLAQWMAVLLDAGTISIAGCCVDCPAPVRTMDQIILQLTVSLDWGAVNDGKVPDLVPNEITAEQTGHRVAVEQMLVSLGLRSGGTAAAAADAVVASAGGNDVEVGDDSGAAPDEGLDEFSYLTESVAELDKALPELEPDGGKGGMRASTKLREYQKQALFWLRSREVQTLRPDAAADKGRSLHPNWAEEKFGSFDRAPWYWNMSTGAVSIAFPAASGEAKGGILADAMGLGKTVQMLALIVTVKPDGAVWSPAATGSGRADAAPQVGATLVICPMSLLGQWRDEVRQLRHHFGPSHAQVIGCQPSTPPYAGGELCCT